MNEWMNEWTNGWPDEQNETNEYQVGTQNPFKEYMSDSNEEELVGFEKNH